jgi:hypothetical protein
MVDYVKAREKADRAITKNGSPGYLRVPASVEEGKPWGSPSGPPTDYPIYGIQETYSEQDIDGTNIQRGDHGFMMTAGPLPIEVDRNHKLVWPLDKSSKTETPETKTYEIVNLLPLAPDGMVLMYQMQVRSSG